MSGKAGESFEKVRGGKLVFKGGLSVDKIQFKGKKKKKKAKALKAGPEGEGEGSEGEGKGGPEGGAGGSGAGEEERDTGIGFAPDGRKKTAKYEEMFPFESRKFGYVAPKEVKTREDALDERAKRKADRYCK